MADVASEWSAECPPGGSVCSACGVPVESEPCKQHQPDAYAAMSGVRVPVSLFERVAGCFACENVRGLPIPFDEVSKGDVLALCGKHWNQWLIRWVDADDEPPCSAHLITDAENRSE